jgi:ribonuclease VapC
MADAPSLHISAATLLELCIVADHRDVTQLTRARIDQFVDLLGMTVEPFDEAQYLVARDGHANYSSKRKGLNFGDCFAYALAKTLRATLIYEGQDFANTDVQRGAVDRDEAQS